MLASAFLVSKLEYDIGGRNNQPENYDSLDILAKDLNLTWYLDETRDYNKLLIPFLNRVAQLGHLERLSLSTLCNQWIIDNEFLDFIELPALTKALVGAITSNKSMAPLDFSSYFLWTFSPQLDFKEIFQSIQKHEGLRTLLTDRYPREDPIPDTRCYRYN
jgi:hypothetical protein